MGDWYDVSGAPANNAQLSSATMRSEFALVQTAMNKLPTLTGNGSKSIFVNAGATALEAVTASTARTRLGVAIGSDVQAWDADLDAIAALAKTDGNFIVGNGTTWVAESGATARTSLGVGTGDSPQFTAINLGHASDTPLTRASAGQLAVDGVTVATASNTLTMSGKTLTSPTINSGAVSGTFTGNSTFSGTTTLTQIIGTNGGATNAAVTLQSALPAIKLIETDAAEDNGTWVMSASGEAFLGAVYSDDLTSNSSWVRVDRTGTTIDTINLTATNVQANGVNVSTNSTSSIHTCQQIELGHASNTTITSPSAGNIAVEGNLVYRAGGTDVPITDGGTGASTAAGALTNLGLTPTAAEINAVCDGATSGSYTAIAAGFDTPLPSAEVYYRISNNVVTLELRLECTGTSNDTTFALSGGPAGIRPSGKCGQTVVELVDNSTDSFGIVTMSSTGTLEFTLLTGSFTASGTKAVKPFVMSYMLTLPS